MALQGIVHNAHMVIRKHLKPGDIAVDATVGAGFDTLALARVVGPSGRVYGFDVQEEALSRARQRLEKEGVEDGVTLFRAGHECMDDFLPADVRGKVKIFTFNLGYLPGSDQQVTTEVRTSLVAIEKAMDFVHPGGIISVAIYSGHPQGAVEQEELKKWAAGVEYSNFRIATYEFINKAKNQETLLMIERVPPRK